MQLLFCWSLSFPPQAPPPLFHKATGCLKRINETNIQVSSFLQKRNHRPHVVMWVHSCLDTLGQDLCFPHFHLFLLHLGQWDTQGRLSVSAGLMSDILNAWLKGHNARTSSRYRADGWPSPARKRAVSPPASLLLVMERSTCLLACLVNYNLVKRLCFFARL